MVVEQIGLNALWGAGAGAAAAVTGYVGNCSVQKFEIKKAAPTAITGCIAGAIAGMLTNDPKAAIAAAWGGDYLRKATRHYIENQAEIASGKVPPV